MQKSVNDIRKEFDDRILMFANKIFVFFAIINFALYLFNFYFLYVNNFAHVELAAKMTILQTVLVIIVVIINIMYRWKSKYAKYISAISLIVFDCILLCIYKDYDGILSLVCIIPLTVVFLDSYFTTIIGVLSLSSFLFLALYNYFTIQGRTILESVWLYYFPMFLAILLTLLLTIFSKIIRDSMLKEKIDEFEIEKTKKDNALAYRIQEGFLKDEFPSNDVYDISACMIPSKDVGGDFYDFYMIDKSRLAMLVADVSGKGIPAALLMANAKTTIKNYISRGVSFEKSLEMANRDIMRENKELQFITIFICIVDLQTGKMNYINAGHVKPLLINKNGEVSKINSKPDFIFGVRMDTRYNSNEYILNPGDRLFICTDGVTERLDINNQLYGSTRLENFLTNNYEEKSEDIIPKILDSLNEHSKGREQNDDITCLLFNYKKKLELEPAYVKDFDVSKDKVSDVLTYIKDILNEKNVPSKIINLIAVASDEWISNVSKYAYEGKDSKKLLNVQIQIYNKVIDIIYTDYGKYFNPLNRITLSGTTKVTNKSKIGGLGIQLTWNIMDKLEYKRLDDKNVVLIEKEY